MEKNQKNDFRARNLRNIFLRHLQPGRVLDLGCGPGDTALELLRRNHTVVAVDIEEDLIAMAREKTKAYKNRIVFHRMADTDFHRLPKEAFDVVIFKDVIEHLHNDRRALKEIARVLKPGGRVLLSTSNLKFLYGQRDVDLGHFRRYNKEDLKKKCKEAGLEVIYSKRWNFLGVIPYIVYEKILGRKINESFRYSKSGGLKGLFRKGLDLWFAFEGHVWVPTGLTIFIVAQKPKV